MSDNDKFNECLDCPGCSGDCGQGCGSCPENLSANETAGSVEEVVEIETSVTSSAPEVQEKENGEAESPEKEGQKSETPQNCKPVEINPMDLDEIAEKTEDLRPKVDPSRGKLDCFNYLADIPGGKADYDIVEVQFKNTRKGFYRNTSNLDLKLGDMVAVESQPGHDIGRVTLVGHLVRNQMKKAGLSEDSEIRKIFRFARPADMEKYYEAKALEIPTMIGSRQIAAELGLKMKIGDVEYQGDGLKAIFYYIADERVDFRQLIKILAERFKIRVEMRQIGARQEAGRIGGIGPCGRPLCCSTWMTNFVTVATSAARHQDLSLNPQKLAGQCAKLKCCLNFEIDTYLESVKKMPPKETRLETLEASWYHFKTDIFKGEITYSSDKKNAVNTITISAERAFEIIEMNSRGEKPASLIPDEEAKTKAQGSYNDILGDDSQIGRFDKKKKKKKKKKDKEAAANAAGASATDAAENSVEETSEDGAVESTNATAPKAKDQAKEQQPKSKNKDKHKDKNTAPGKSQEEVKETENPAEQNRTVQNQGGQNAEENHGVENHGKKPVDKNAVETQSERVSSDSSEDENARENAASQPQEKSEVKVKANSEPVSDAVAEPTSEPPSEPNDQTSAEQATVPKTESVSEPKLEDRQAHKQEQKPESVSETASESHTESAAVDKDNGSERAESSVVTAETAQTSEAIVETSVSSAEVEKVEETSSKTETEEPAEFAGEYKAEFVAEAESSAESESQTSAQPVEAFEQKPQVQETVSNTNGETPKADTEESAETSETSEPSETTETVPEHKHHNHPGHHNHHNPEHNGKEKSREVGAENENDFGQAKDQNPNKKGNNPNKGPWQGKNQGKVFKPQPGKGPEGQKNREPGKVFKPQQGKGAEQSQYGQPQNGQLQHGQPQHQHGPQQHGQQFQPRGPQSQQQSQGKEPFKHKGQNPQQEGRGNKENPGKVYKPQRQGEQSQRPEHQGQPRPGNPREGQPTHQGHGPNAPREEFQNQGGPNNKKKKKNPTNPNQQPNPQGNHPEQGRPFNQGHNDLNRAGQGHHNPNRPQHPQGQRPAQNPKAGNPNAGGGNSAGGNASGDNGNGD